jgi:hypothetical protein
MLIILFAIIKKTDCYIELKRCKICIFCIFFLRFVKKAVPAASELLRQKSRRLREG